MKCRECVNNKDMAQIPFVAHEYRMELAYKREKRLKVMLIGTNSLWLVGAFIFLIMR